MFFGLSYSAWNAHAPYCHLWSLRLYSIFTLFHKRHDFWKKVTEYKMRGFAFSTNFIPTILHYKKNWSRYNQKCMSVCRWSADILVRFSRNMNFLEIFPKSTPKSHFIKILPVADQFCHVDRRTDMTKLIVALQNFAKAPNNEGLHSSSDQPAGQWPDRFRLAFVLRTPI